MENERTHAPAETGQHQRGPVGHPSVITCALNTAEETKYKCKIPNIKLSSTQNTRAWTKTFPERYERQQNNQNSWDERQPRKFQEGAQANNYNAVAKQRVGQQGYFDSNGGHQVTLQDLSSCRGDPMSIVENLQQQQSCQVAQVEVKLVVKRRKSTDKSSGEAPRVLQLHQDLMVPQPHGHHPSPPLPYFVSFHLLPHPAVFSSTVELVPITNYPDESAQPSSAQFQQQEEQPKVVVPNIEEELNFLLEGTTGAPEAPMTKDEPNGPGSGFVSSYLKFLQRKRNSSPPQFARRYRKQTTCTRLKPASLLKEALQKRKQTTCTRLKPAYLLKEAQQRDHSYAKSPDAEPKEHPRHL